MLSPVSLHVAAEVENSIMFILKATFQQLAEERLFSRELIPMEGDDWIFLWTEIQDGT